MNATRSLFFSLLIIVLAFGSAAAQSRGRRIPPRREFQFFDPRNQLEELDSRLETVLVKGHTPVGGLSGPNGTARIEALEIRDTSDGTRASGVMITISSSDNPERQAIQVRSLIDYDEIDLLVRNLDAVAKASDTVTKLTQFDVHYRTKVDFEIIVFKQTSGGVAAALEAGYQDRARMLITLDDLNKLRWMIVQAKARLDEAK